MKSLLCITLALTFLTGLCAANPRKVLKFKGNHAPPKNPIMKVVLVHGWLETGLSWDLMKKHLEKQQIGCQVVKLTPADARGGLEKLSQQLKVQIENVHGNDQRISIIAFSMGGLVSRHYLQELGGAERCDQLITISSPHHGTAAAYLYPSKGVKQMRPNSKFLQKLEKSEDQLGDMPLVSYHSPLDLVILPAKNSHWDRAANISYMVPLHPMMVTSQRVIKNISKRLLEVHAAKSSP